MKKLNEEEKDRINKWKFLLLQFRNWKEADESLFKKLIYGEDEVAK